METIPKKKNEWNLGYNLATQINLNIYSQIKEVLQWIMLVKVVILTLVRVGIAAGPTVQTEDRHEFQRINFGMTYDMGSCEEWKTL